SSACYDINAGAFHVIVANQLGLKNQGFVLEIDPGSQIWNQPAYGYQVQLLGSAEPEIGARGVRVHATLLYTDELEKSLWDPVTGTSAFVGGKLQLDYILDLDSAGRIIGGSWTRGRGPDFAWIPTVEMRFGDGMDGLNQIYKPVSTP